MCLSVCAISKHPLIWVLERLLVKGHIANIGLPKHDLIFFNDFFLFKKENVFLASVKKTAPRKMFVPLPNSYLLNKQRDAGNSIQNTIS